MTDNLSIVLNPNLLQKYKISQSETHSIFFSFHLQDIDLHAMYKTLRLGHLIWVTLLKIFLNKWAVQLSVHIMAVL